MSNNRVDKNLDNIDKVIRILSYRDYLGKWNSMSNKERANYLLRRSDFSYEFGAETNKVREFKHNYMSGNISDAQYKEFCAKYKAMLN